MSRTDYEAPDCSAPLQSKQSDIKSMFARQMPTPSTAAAVPPRGVGGGGPVADGVKGRRDSPVGSLVEAKHRAAPGSLGRPAGKPTSGKRQAKPSQPSQPSAKRQHTARAAADAADARAKQPSMLAFVDKGGSGPASPHSAGKGGKGKPAAAAAAAAVRSPAAVKRKAETSVKQPFIDLTDDYDF
jgi:hypothetical protein